MSNYEGKKTPSEWEVIDDVLVINPSGWDNTNGYNSWPTPISRRQWLSRLKLSTAILGNTSQRIKNGLRDDFRLDLEDSAMELYTTNKANAESGIRSSAHIGVTSNHAETQNTESNTTTMKNNR